jgi:hypothetical protein
VRGRGEEKLEAWKRGGRGVDWVGGRGGVASYGQCTSSLIRIKRREGGGGVILGSGMLTLYKIMSA